MNTEFTNRSICVHFYEVVNGSFYCVKPRPGLEVCALPVCNLERKLLTLAIGAKMLVGLLTVFLAAFSLVESKHKDVYAFKAVNSRGKLVSLDKYRGSVSETSWPAPVAPVRCCDQLLCACRGSVYMKNVCRGSNIRHTSTCPGWENGDLCSIPGVPSATHRPTWHHGLRGYSLLHPPSLIHPPSLLYPLTLSSVCLDRYEPIWTHRSSNSLIHGPCPTVKPPDQHMNSWAVCSWKVKPVDVADQICVFVDMLKENIQVNIESHVITQVNGEKNEKK